MWTIWRSKKSLWLWDANRLLWAILAGIVATVAMQTPWAAFFIFTPLLGARVVRLHKKSSTTMTVWDYKVLPARSQHRVFTAHAAHVEGIDDDHNDVRTSEKEVVINQGQLDEWHFSCSEAGAVVDWIRGARVV